MAEPGGSGPVGPYPDGVEADDQRADYDKLRRRVLWKMPYGLYVIGSRGDEPTAKNLMTANWSKRLGFNRTPVTSTRCRLHHIDAAQPARRDSFARLSQAAPTHRRMRVVRRTVSVAFGRARFSP